MAISDDKEGLGVASSRSITSDSQESEMQMHFTSGGFYSFRLVTLYGLCSSFLVSCECELCLSLATRLSGAQI